MHGIAKIAEWLKIHGKVEMDGKNYSFSTKDEPWMQFAAELQRHREHDVLIISYYFEENGDLCPDPEFWFTLTPKGELKSVRYNHWLGGMSLCELRDDLEFATEFASLVYSRHMANRSEVVTTEV
jgi:hypothetical protein